ncbi:hypothetical protein MCOR14_005463 [Pyricularia oryzae]|uniref:Uncharacterized protein n=1 Tax=Pyricularia grisea TaxID=148305 RepID=A0ABQ8NDC3_PYRGI|nr:hypothetical protein MCOR01_010149 [Pyricularia oryzae]KAI6294708.1 hypothetical protein MCOR33_008212 [Pyricularia grisea]KAI6392585.1 hypothetical protein MCOR23_008394 [Pyricularia oryzae]KAI6401385.1 hypothetical protein MCOR20_008064 [Pyricularia oryzae]KAI6445204.1 hypothetical protein MCOR15_010815 [Pyricularia oryzae]
MVTLSDKFDSPKLQHHIQQLPTNHRLTGVFNVTSLIDSAIRKLLPACACQTSPQPPWLSAVPCPRAGCFVFLRADATEYVVERVLERDSMYVVRPWYGDAGGGGDNPPGVRGKLVVGQGGVVAVSRFPFVVRVDEVAGLR